LDGIDFSGGQIIRCDCVSQRGQSRLRLQGAGEDLEAGFRNLPIYPESPQQAAGIRLETERVEKAAIAGQRVRWSLDPGGGGMSGLDTYSDCIGSEKVARFRGIRRAGTNPARLHQGKRDGMPRLVGPKIQRP
jgi:hypothetical protein